MLALWPREEEVQKCLILWGIICDILSMYEACFWISKIASALQLFITKFPGFQIPLCIIFQFWFQRMYSPSTWPSLTFVWFSKQKNGYPVLAKRMNWLNSKLRKQEIYFVWNMSFEKQSQDNQGHREAGRGGEGGGLVSALNLLKGAWALGVVA